ncbi:phage tail protein [Danxiaibacter flavus]|uniref:Phage tail protein n=1 Tax=Danxiaibacter flavus TaxID=3049108 RepID=A0ABV3ZB56_9BACT|nr:phage tail protein [Chitinophagaceae bacterium DXS]
MAYPYDVPVSFRFNVKIQDAGGEYEGSFQDVSGLNVSIEMETINEGGVNDYSYKIPKRVKYDNLVLKRGLLKSSSLVTWINDAVRNFKFSTRKIDVLLLDEEMNPLVTWSFFDAYPVSVKVSDLKAKENELVFESLEFAYSYFERS